LRPARAKARVVPLQIRPLHPLFGAEVAGFDAAGDAEARAFEDALGRYGLLLVRDARLDDEALTRFAGRFGPLQNMGGTADAPRAVIGVTNIAADGRMKTAEDAQRRQHDANLLWHADSSFMAPGATHSFLLARIVPDEGGDTEFLDTRAAFDALDADRQAALRPLTARHSIQHSWRLVGVELPGHAGAEARPVARKLVRRHGPSGREALVIPSHVERIEGLDDAAGQALLAELTAIAAAPERIYRHRWRPGDLLVWDNRCMLHRATPYRAFEDPRELRSCRVVDVADDGLAVTVS
jgi:alpha-ketoglutarate-dependent 2,4-dichlorophenoxyacetate dioxygenase